MCLTHTPRGEEARRLQQPWKPPSKLPSTAGQAQRARRTSELCLPGTRRCGERSVSSMALFMSLSGLCLRRNWGL